MYTLVYNIVRRYVAGCRPDHGISFRECLRRDAN